jgi:fatty acid desaturase
MKRGRMHYPLRYRRARSLLYAIGLFWLWLWFGSAASLELLYGSPVHAALAMYGLAVVILVSIPAALLAVIRMVLTRPRRDAVVVELPRSHALVVRGEGFLSIPRLSSA